MIAKLLRLACFCILAICLFGLNPFARAETADHAYAGMVGYDRSPASILNFFFYPRLGSRRFMRRGYYYEGKRYRTCSSIPAPDAKKACESRYFVYFIVAFVFFAINFARFFLGRSTGRGHILLDTAPHGSMKNEALTNPIRTSFSSGKISSLIQSYALKNPIWDESHLSLLGRNISIAYFKTLESGNPSLLHGFITENFEVKLKQALTLQSRLGAPHFGALSCTGVEITFAKDSPACFVIRANMQAQRVGQQMHSHASQISSFIPFTGFFTYRFAPTEKKFLLDSVKVPKFA